MATLSKEADKDNPLYFSGDAEDFAAFKTEVQKIADQKDCTFSWKPDQLFLTSFRANSRTRPAVW